MSGLRFGGSAVRKRWLLFYVVRFRGVSSVFGLFFVFCDNWDLFIFRGR